MAGRKRKERQESEALSAQVSWERARGIFGDPRPPRRIWERQFDFFDEELQRIARTPYEEINFSDLWYYHHDLAYAELQPDLFDYLFPVCLMDWHRSLMENKPCSHGDSEFHKGVHQGDVFEKMLTPGQRSEVFRLFRDSFLCRLDAERGFVHSGSKTPAYSWMGRFNSLGLVMPGIQVIWDSWWSLDTPGRAVAALQWCSGLMYLEGQNPLFGFWTPENGGGGPYLWCDDSHILESGWLPENVAFLADTLSPEFVSDRVGLAASRLRGEPEEEIAQRLKHDLPECQELVRLRIAVLPKLLSDPDLEGWSSLP